VGLSLLEKPQLHTCLLGRDIRGQLQYVQSTRDNLAICKLVYFNDVDEIVEKKLAIHGAEISALSLRTKVKFSYGITLEI